MIRMNAHIAGYDVTLEGTADEVMQELEALKEGLFPLKTFDPGPVTASEVVAAQKDTRSLTTREEDKKNPTNKGPGTHDDQPDLPIDERTHEDVCDEIERAIGGEPMPPVHDQKYKVEDVRRAIQAASRESKQAAKQYLIDAVGKADLNQLPAEKYAELMKVVGGAA